MIGVGVGVDDLGDAGWIGACGLEAFGDLAGGGLEARAGARVHEDHVASRLEQQRAGLELGLFALDHGAEQGLELFGLGIGKQREIEQERAIAHHGDIIGALLEGIGAGQGEGILRQNTGGDQARGAAQEFAAVEQQMFFSIHGDA